MGDILRQRVKLFVFSQIFDRKISALESSALVRRRLFRLLRSQETSNKVRQYYLCVVAIHWLPVAPTVCGRVVRQAGNYPSGKRLFPTGTDLGFWSLV